MLILIKSLQLLPSASILFWNQNLSLWVPKGETTGQNRRFCRIWHASPVQDKYLHRAQPGQDQGRSFRCISHGTNSFCTGDVKEVKPHHCLYSLIPNKNGGIIDDFIISKLPDFVNIVVNSGTTPKDLKHINSK